MSITDIAACAELAQRRGVLVGVDNTFATPVLTRPLELGADIVMHSATKYLGGHSDVLGGALVVGDRELYDRLYFIQNATGGVMGPLESFLCSRGLKTLELRSARAMPHGPGDCRVSGGRSARASAFIYPGLPEHPGHALAARQMDGAVRRHAQLRSRRATSPRPSSWSKSTRLFQLAVSLGAVESLIEQPAAMSHASYDRARSAGSTASPTA